MSAETIIDTGTEELLCVIRDRVAIITLNRPQARNSLSDHLTPALRTMIRTCGENRDVGALLITGAGTAFCSGGDVKGMGANRDKKKQEMSYDEKVADLQERQRLLTGALVAVRKPTIAALPGPAAGAGAVAARLEREVLEDLGRVQLFEREDLGGNRPEHGAGAAVLVEGVDAEARQLRNFKGKIGLEELFVGLALLVVHDVVHHAVHFLVGKCRHVDTFHVAVDANHGRNARGQVQVRRIVLDGEGQELRDVDSH